MQSAYLTVAEVAADLGLSSDGVYKLIKRGKLPAIRRSERGLRVSRVVLDAYKRRLQNGDPAVPILYVDAPLEELRSEFEEETKLSPAEWERRWKADQFEDSAENMSLAIRALGLLLHEQHDRRHGGDRQGDPSPMRRSAA